MIDPLASDQDKPNPEPQSAFDDKPAEVPISRPGNSASDVLKPTVQEAATRTSPTAPTEPNSQKDKPSSFRRALGAARVVLPAILPLLEGNVALAATNLLTGRGKQADLSSVENALTRLRSEQSSLRSDVFQHKTTLRQFEDQLRLLKEAADQNAHERQGLEENLHSLRKRFAIFAWIATVLLVAAILMDLYLVLQLHNGRP